MFFLHNIIGDRGPTGVLYCTAAMIFHNISSLCISQHDSCGKRLYFCIKSPHRLRSSNDFSLDSLSS